MSKKIGNRKIIIILFAVIAILTVAAFLYHKLITDEPASMGDDSKEPSFTEIGKEPNSLDDHEIVYYENFKSGTGVASQAGGAALTQVTGKNFEGNEDGAALYISNRSNNWDAADFRFADIGLESGKTYMITISGYVDSDVSVPSGGEAWLQTVSSYTWLASASFEPGQAFTITKEFTVDTSKDSGLRIQSSNEGASVPFYIGSILITVKPGPVAHVVAQRPPALPFSTITFEDQTMGGFVARSGASEILTVTDEANHTPDGTYALKVEGREKAWHGPSLRVEKYIDEGSEYIVSVWVKLIEPASAQIQLSTQIGDGNAANYVNLNGKTVTTEDGWVKLEGKYRYSNLSSEYITIYVESANHDTASFYIDDISFESTGLGTIAIQKDLIPLKDAYRNDFMIGSAISTQDLQGVRFGLLKLHYNSVTAENAMKPGALQRDKGIFTFDAADEMVNTALNEGFQVYGHVLVWHQQSPDWMYATVDTAGNKVPLEREEALENLRTHIKTVIEHFGERVTAWDVINEAIIDNPPNPTDWRASLRQSLWYHAIGDDYVEQAFLAAREVLDEKGWNITLYYNDYNDDNQGKALAIYSMVKEINEKYAAVNPGKLLIDGVGMQGHYNLNTSPTDVRLSLERFISLGVRVSITELDIQAGSNAELSEDFAIAQGKLYAELFKVFREHSANIERVTLWGMDDGSSWRFATSPLLFDRSLQAKPAYYAVIAPEQFITENEPQTSEDTKQAIANYGTPVIDGLFDDIWKNTPEIPINHYLLAWQGATGSARALWDEENLYVLIQVSDTQLDKRSTDPWQQDSVEVFLDENNGKTTFYQNDDGQYRVNFDNEVSFNPFGIGTGFESATHIAGTNYTVEMKIPFRTITPKDGMKLGFDLQVNDGKDGARQSVATWNDTTGNAYQDTSVFGVLTLIEK